MVFSDPVFLFVFLPIALGTYWLWAWHFRNAFLVIVGSIFYIWGGKGLVLLLFGSILITYYAGQLIENQRNRERESKPILVTVVSLLIGSLIFWKYSSFLLDQISNFGLGKLKNFDIALPIAISFYTFQCISYIVDVYRRNTNVSRSLIDFSAYILLFPHLIAGPIVRYSDIEKELKTKPLTKFDDFVAGAPRFFWGLAKKVIIADQVSVLVERVFSLPNQDITAAVAWIGAFSFAIQIYFDFSGYSDMAIGLARMFGFTFPENFKRPYASTSITEFWRRWHISLSSWFRDYVYIPLGGNKVSTRLMYRNLIVVFLLTGVWHGANWVFIFWGLFHGFWILLERITGLDQTPNRKSLLITRRFFTFVIVSLGWILFRSSDLSQSTSFYSAIIEMNFQVPTTVQEVLTRQRATLFAIGLLVSLFGGVTSIGERLSNRENSLPSLGQIVVVAIIAPISLIYCLTGTFSPFLYFQF